MVLLLKYHFLHLLSLESWRFCTKLTHGFDIERKVKQKNNCHKIMFSNSTCTCHEIVLLFKDFCFLAVLIILRCWKLVTVAEGKAHKDKTCHSLFLGIPCKIEGRERVIRDLNLVQYVINLGHWFEIGRFRLLIHYIKNDLTIGLDWRVKIGNCVP